MNFFRPKSTEVTASPPMSAIRRRTRDEHLFGPGPKRILALDGGGVRGILSIQFVKRIEEILRARYGGNPDFRLSDYFDLFAGTSTGAIIAAGLAVGKTAEEIEKLYMELAPDVFGAYLDKTGIFWAKFSARNLTRHLNKIFGSVQFGSEEIKSGLAVISKRVDTDSAWILVNNPRSKFWEDSEDGVIGNGKYELKKVVRASTAAPHYFPPQEIRIADRTRNSSKVDGVFLDGGITPHNNPSLAALMVARLKGHRIEWLPGKDNLLIVSIGTGSWRVKRLTWWYKRWMQFLRTLNALQSVIVEGERFVLTMMQWLSYSPRPWTINSEIDDLKDDHLATDPICTFQRFNAVLEPDWLKNSVKVDTDRATMNQLRNMASTSQLSLLAEIGKRSALASVQESDFPASFDLSK
jgi:hypothetical protein